MGGRGDKLVYRVGSRSCDANQEDRDSSLHAAGTWLTVIPPENLKTSFDSDKFDSTLLLVPIGEKLPLVMVGDPIASDGNYHKGGPPKP